jgi:hypothetical protein
MRALLRGVLVLWMLQASHLAHAGALTLGQATSIAARGTLFLEIVYTDCEKGVSRTEDASGFLVSDDGLVVTAAHMFVADDEKCEHQITVIHGQHDKNTARRQGDEPVISLKLARPLDRTHDLALLQIDGPVPGSMYRLAICTGVRLQSGESLYAFGYPVGKLFTPLRVDYSGSDAEFQRFAVSGLITFGMSGGPVLDGYGRVVAVVTGGVLKQGAQIYAVGYVTPIGPIITTNLAHRLAPECGYVQRVEYRSLEMDPKAGADDQMACGFGIPKGFEGHMDPGRSTYWIEWDRKARESGTLSMVNSQFRIGIRRISIAQAGVTSEHFDGDRNVLPCEAACGWYRKSAADAISELSDETWKSHVLRATRTSVIDQLSSLTPEQCIDDSVWPSAFVDGRARYDAVKISLPVGEQVTTERIWINGSDTQQIATLFHFNIQGGEKDAIDQAISRGALTADAVQSGRAMRFIVETDLDEHLEGINATCRAFTNMHYSDFRELCHAVLGRVLAKRGIQGGTCLTPVPTEPTEAEIH